MLKYTLSEEMHMRLLDLLFIEVRFVTLKKQGILIQLQDDSNEKTITLRMNNNGESYPFYVSYHTNYYTKCRRITCNQLLSLV